MENEKIDEEQTIMVKGLVDFPIGGIVTEIKRNLEKNCTEIKVVLKAEVVKDWPKKKEIIKGYEKKLDLLCYSYQETYAGLVNALVADKGAIDYYSKELWKLMREMYRILHILPTIGLQPAVGQKEVEKEMEKTMRQSDIQLEE